MSSGGRTAADSTAQSMTLAGAVPTLTISVVSRSGFFATFQQGVTKGMVVLLILVCLSFPTLRIYARHVERSSGEPVDKVHRLRRAVLAYLLLALPVMVAATFELRYERQLLGRGIVVAVAVAAPLAVIGSLLGAQMGIRPVYERLRRTEGTTRNVSRRLIRALAVLLAPQAVWLGLLFWLRRNEAHPALLWGLAVVFLISVAASGPYIVRAAMPGREPTRAEAERMSAICAAHGVKIRSVRVLDTEHDPMVNAAFSGFGPAPKYIFVTDRLLEDFSQEQLEAVLAHEIGHRKKHHIAIKLGALLGTALVAAVALASVGELAGGDALKVLALGLPLILVATILLIQGWVGIRLERQADDYAARTVGAETLHSALTRMAEFNLMRRRTGRLWNLLQQHPGLDSRLDRLAGAMEPRPKVPGNKRQT